MIDQVRALLAQAREDDQRRLLVLSGRPANTRELAAEILDGVDLPLGETSYVGPADSLQCETLGYNRAADLLGTTRSAVVLDCHERCEPNHIGQLVGTVDGGGLFVLLTPPLDTWSERRDDFDETLAVPPFETADVTGWFRKRLAGTLDTHRGVAVVDADTRTVERNGLVEYGPPARRQGSDSSADHSFPGEAYDRCITADQRAALDSLEALCDTGEAVVVEANRGRGKSAIAGFAAASLAHAGHDIVVTGPQYRNVATLIEHAQGLLAELESLDGARPDDNPRVLDSHGTVRYVPVEDLDSLDSPDCLIVDEAAALPVRRLESTLAVPSVAYITTTHGYEGTGRGFAVRFRERLRDGQHDVTEVGLSTPVRHAPGDPVEVWSFRALALDAHPPVSGVLAGASPESVTFRRLSSEQLCADETLLREVFGLLVFAHYRTEPNDLMRLLDAPNVSVHGLFQDGHPVSVALLSQEGGLSPDTCKRVYEGERIRGNMIPDVLTSQLRDRSAGETLGYRVMRIATHGDVRSVGFGSRLLDELAREYSDADWLGVGYGATADLVAFWRQNDFAPVHLSTTRNRRSGEHSVIMLRPLSPAGEELLSTHTEWFLERLPETLPDALADADTDVVRAVCRAVETTPTVEVSEFGRRHLVSVASGPGIFETAPGPVRSLALAALVDGPESSLLAREERLLVGRCLQLRPAETVAANLDYDAASTCNRALGGVVETLLGEYDLDDAESN
nr:tRNA(Met) cytidine acetyltransferase TmcA [Halovenus aranensis]